MNTRTHGLRPRSGVNSGHGGYAAAGRQTAWMLAVLIWVVPWVTGCSSQPAEKFTPSASGLQTRQAERDHLALALENLVQRDEFPPERAARQVLYHLNRWVRDQGADPRWIIDRRLINTLPIIIRNSPGAAECLSDKVLAQLEYREGDVRFLEECRWAQAVAQWASRNAPDPAFDKWVGSAGLTPQSARQLADCERLFRWTVRNVQLEALIPYPQQPTAGPADLVESRNPMATWPAPMRGVPGPGYRLHPWEVLLYGYGDMLERARVFVLLTRQLHLDTVLLGIKTRSERPRAWLPAVLLDGQLFLFDMELGQPIPGPDDAPIATLAQVRQHPELLTGLDVGDKYQYRVRPAELENVVALVDAAPEAIAQRMRVLETHLDATHQMVLTVSPSRLKRDLEAAGVVQDVALWAVPIEADMFGQVRAMVMMRDEKVRISEILDHGVMMGISPLVKARRQYLLGNFNGNGDIPGATTGYASVRTPTDTIQNIAKSKEVREQLGLKRTGDMNDRQWVEQLQTEQYLRIQAKQNASYWMGVLQLEQGRYGVAANWFEKRTLDAWPEGRWRGGARWNLAACYEALNQPDRARELYLIDDSPQRHGSLLRARRLEQLGNQPASPLESAGAESAGAAAESPSPP